MSHTSISSLPTKGLGGLRHLILKVTPSLKYFPSVLEFRKIERAELTYPHHCCAFKNPEKQNPSAWKAKQAQEMINKRCALSTTPMPTSSGKVTSSTFKANIDIWKSGHFGNYEHHGIVNAKSGKPNSVSQDVHGVDSTANGDFLHTDLFGGFEQPNYLETNYQEHGIGRNVVKYLNDTKSKVSADSSQSDPFGDFKQPNEMIDTIDGQEALPHAVFHKSTVSIDANLTQRAQCGEIYIYNRNIACTPEPDALNPCEDVMGYVWLRVTVWFVLLAALLGNSVVLIVLTTSRGKFTVPKFLMCNLAFADFMMGVYLILLASIDIYTLGEYFNHAVQWQNEGGCQAAGFLSVFSSELSVFTLTILTLERWYAISHAIHLNKRLRLRQSIALMIFGYTFTVILALLPLVGISSYGNVSICLPMKTERGIDIGYVVSLLIMNGVMFLAICFCYISMYLSVKGSAATARSNDATIAKRMSLLVFTNFACWAPIAFFGLTASAGMPLIDITNSKILLVFFYPLNSCANPFLYAILTKQFRKDFFILLGKCGICVERANMYRGTFTSRTLSHSRGNRDSKIHRLHRHTESVFSYLSATNQSTKHSVNGTPKIHPSHQDSTETQPFIEQRNHLTRAAEFANKEPVLGSDDVALDPWDTNDTNEPRKPSHPKYIRSVSDYVQSNSKKVAVGKTNSRTRTSVDTFFSSSTDTTCLSDNSHLSDDLWQVRKECLEHKNNVKEKDNEISDTDEKQLSFIDYSVDEEDPLSNEDCYMMASDFVESEGSTQFGSESRKGDNMLPTKPVLKPMYNNVGEVRSRYCRSPSLSSLDETYEMRFLAQAKLDGVSGSSEEKTTTEFSSDDIIGTNTSDA